MGSIKWRRMGYGVSLAAVAVAFVARWWLDPLLGDRLPLATFVIAVIVAAWAGGLRPALLATGLGLLLSVYFFMPPRHSWLLAASHQWVGLAMYLLISCAITGFAGSMRRTQRRITEQSEQLRITLASIGDAVISTDASGNITYLNAVAESLTGWVALDAVGLPLTKVCNALDENTRLAIECPTTRALSEGVVVGLADHAILVASDGVEHPINGSAAPMYSKGGEVVGCVLMFRDISARRQLERQNVERLATARLLSAIVDSSSDAIISKSLSGIVQSWNVAAERLLGYSAAQAVGRHISFVIPPERLDEEDRIMARIRNGDHVEHLDTVRLRSDGQRVPVSVSISPVRSESGPVAGASTIVRDMTAQKRGEEELRRLALQLSEADRRKDEFLATLAHELRNPLAPISNGLEIMRKSTGGAGSLEAVRAMMERQVAQLVHLVDDLLDVSRISRGKLELRRQPIELAQVLHSAVEASRPHIDGRNLTLTLTLPSEPIFVDADLTRLVQVFANLLNNAAKYNDQGGSIQVTLKPEGSMAVVSVQDTGIGISPEMLPGIFDMFAQVTQSLEQSQGGLGIGLSLVKRLAEMHGGKVEARSDGRGKGSEFIVRLPVLMSGARESTARTDTVEPIRPSVHRRVLVADDNQDAADSLAAMLRSMGSDVRTAYGGAAAVDQAATFRPELVFLDIGMPELSGIEACRRMRTQPWGKRMTMVAVTGWGSDEHRRLSSEAGFDVHLVKPVNPATIEALLIGDTKA